ncbi:hypothetical protein D7Y44_05950 [Stenotrophomonas maltophilia]|uniref:hypothetical protein n=1 Tax=Stenotrophomonas maltophilia TaxID=40324 RepID=UPI0015DDC873|nr:hypothetical protein [Stenotrophomonas maltophilia]MBA0280842.1 hypothetical protein [Stenotrophomonas maltophilia]MBA0344208.1 hypothetical protein [Stenotrophomonas maltophilia]MBA0356992.1 hypothetical protein [Stenotrophomonas maltophilia]MBA0518925.1 hypothetical protein [Stenotrophomonas maltophilia]
MNKEGPAFRRAFLFAAPARFAAVTFLRVKKVGSIGERAISTIVVQYDTLDTLVDLKIKALIKVTPDGHRIHRVSEHTCGFRQIAIRRKNRKLVAVSVLFDRHGEIGT